MTPLSYTYIERVAALTREIVLGKNNSAYSNPNPLDLNDDIKVSMGIQILYTDTNNFDGCLWWNDKFDYPEIIITRRDKSYRQEFTIAHELGHLLLHWKWLPDEGMQNDAKKYASTQLNMLDVVPLYRGKKKNKEDPKEYQANEFASDFLMPKSGVQSIYSKVYNDKLTDSENADNTKYLVSKQFNPSVVSNGAAYERIRNMQSNGEFIG